MVSWIDASNQFAHGNLHPLWASSPAFNAGEPRFIFYPPLSWMLGGLTGLLLTHIPGVSPARGWNEAPIVFTWMALALSGTTMYWFARRYASSGGSLLAAVAYLVNPYILFTAYERTAYGELLAAAWMPLLLDTVLREELTAASVALPVALLWLTNAPAAVMGCYALAFLGLFRVVVESKWSGEEKGSEAPAWMLLASKLGGGVILGLSLAAIYLIPAVYERRFVQASMAIIVDMRIDHNFLFEHTGSSADAVAHDHVLHTASMIAVLLLCATFSVLAIARHQRRTAEAEYQTMPQRSGLPLTALALLTAGIAAMLLPISKPLWRLIPEAHFLQFPWRLLAVLTPVLAVTTAVCVDRWTRRVAKLIPRSSRGRRLGWTVWSLLALAIALMLVSPAYRAFQQACDVKDIPASWLASIEKKVGTEPTDEYTPTDADNDSLKPNRPPYWLTESLNGAPPGLGKIGRPGPAPRKLTVDTREPGYLVLDLREYPLWHLSLNGKPASSEEVRVDGLIAIPIPAGTSTLDVSETVPEDVRAGEFVSGIALAAWMMLLVKGTRRRRNGVPHLNC